MLYVLIIDFIAEESSAVWIFQFITHLMTDI